jgi:hypothetical protein
MDKILANLLQSGEKLSVEENTASVSIEVELSQLYERAHRAVNESKQLSEDFQFILWWRRMRPRPGVRPARLLE